MVTDSDDDPDRRRGLARFRAGLTWRRLFGHALLLALAVTLALAPFAVTTGAVMPGDPPPARAGPLSQPDCANEPAGQTVEPRVRATVERVSGQRQLEVTYNLSARDDPDLGQPFTVTTAGTGVEVVEADGFRRAGDGYEWDGPSRPSLVYEIPRGNGSGGLAGESPRYGVGSEWALAPLPRSVGARVGYTVQPDGVVSAGQSGRLVYVGPLEAATATRGCQRITIYTPPQVESVDGDKLSSAVASAAEEYPAGRRSGRVRGVVVPGDIGVGGYALGNFFTVNPHSNLSATTIAIHEYVHTRQRASYGPEMQWFVEAQASFYMFRLQRDAGGMSTAEYALWMHEFHDRATWGEPFSPEDTRNHYTRGTVTLAALDQRIRRATDGDRSLLDVVRRLEDRGDPVTMDAFEATVETVSGQSMDPWIQRHVAEGEPVAVPAPDGGSLSAGTWRGLASYQYLADELPAAVAVYALVWYGVLFSGLRTAVRIWRVVG